MSVHDAKHDFKYPVFKVIVYLKYELKIFSGHQISYWSVVGWSVVVAIVWCLVGRWSVVGWSVSRWSVVVGWLVGGFKETWKILKFIILFILKKEGE